VNNFMKIMIGGVLFLFVEFSFAHEIVGDAVITNYERDFIRKIVISNIRQSKEYRETERECKELEKIGLNPVHCENYSGILDHVRILSEKGDFSEKGDKGIAAIVVFFIGSGHSSFRQHLFAFLQKGDGPLELSGSIDLKSTRGGVENFRIENGFIMMDSIQYQDGDAGCCPSARKPVKYKVENGKLIEVLAK